MGFRRGQNVLFGKTLVILHNMSIIFSMVGTFKPSFKQLNAISKEKYNLDNLRFKLCTIHHHHQGITQSDLQQTSILSLGLINSCHFRLISWEKVTYFLFTLIQICILQYPNISWLSGHFWGSHVAFLALIYIIHLSLESVLSHWQMITSQKGLLPNMAKYSNAECLGI